MNHQIAYEFRGKDFTPFFIGLFPYINRVGNYIRQGGRIPENTLTNAKILSYMLYQCSTIGAGTLGSALGIANIEKGLEELVASIF